MAKKQTKQPTFTAQLRAAIAESGLTRYQLSKQSGVEQSALSRFVSGERGLTTDSLDELAKVLGLEIVIHKPKRPVKR